MVELSDRERQALTLLSARAASREVGRAHRTEVRRVAKGAIG
jgi:hypothetical protein